MTREVVDVETVFGAVDETVYETCECGRELRKLNVASDTSKCVGCGYVAEVCRCGVLGERDG